MPALQGCGDLGTEWESHGRTRLPPRLLLGIPRAAGPERLPWAPPQAHLELRGTWREHGCAEAPAGLPSPSFLAGSWTEKIIKGDSTLHVQGA